MVHVAVLEDRSCLRIRGADARSFLHNLVTCDVEHLSPQSVTFGALLSPQGKVLFDFFIKAEGDGFLLDCPQATVDALVQRLGFYRLRAAVSIEPAPELRVFSRWDGAEATGDGRRKEMGERLYANRLDTDTDGDAYHVHRMSIGVPEALHDFGYGEVFPHDVLMDCFQSGGVDFSKGCFIGQEVVSRMKHRGTARNRFVRVTAVDDLPPKGTPLVVQDRQIGTMGGSSGGTGLALVRIDKVGQALRDGLAIMADAKPVTLSLPDFAPFDFSAETTA